MALPTFKNEVLGDINGDFEPRYDFQYFQSTGKLKLLNPIEVQGTMHNADTMNNLINYDNNYSFPECEKTMSFPEGKALVEWRYLATNTLVATVETTWSTMEKVYKLYDQNGITVIQQRTVTMAFSNGKIKTVVTL